MRPFLKWAGNKYRIINEIKGILPEGKRLVEPFAGSGAVFINTEYPLYWLNDSNSDLINLYRVLIQEGEEFIEYCRSFFVPENNSAERYYELRELFNETNDTILKSALFVYLNRHGYNGLMRYNKQGKYNVPFGRYKKPYFPEKEVRYFLKKAERAVFSAYDFAKVMKAVQVGDVVYCDPPYVPVSNTVTFREYNREGFSIERHKELTQLAIELSKRGIPVIISNHDTEYVRETYEGAKIKRLQVRRFISCDGANRRKANEVLALFC